MLTNSETEALLCRQMKMAQHLKIISEFINILVLMCKWYLNNKTFLLVCTVDMMH